MTKNSKIKVIPVFTIHLPEYKVDAEPDHKRIGKIVDSEIKKSFYGTDYIVAWFSFYRAPRQIHR